MTTTTSPLALSSSIIINRPNPNPNPNAKPSCLALTTRTTRKAICCCQVAVKSNDPTTTTTSSESSSPQEEEGKIGSRVKVKVPLKVYHVPRVPEIDLTGMEGKVKQYVGVWKGKRISANLPYKVEFVTQIEGRGAVKFFAHLKDDEFDYLD